jgi:exosortase/archaeosortase family protein
LRRAAIIFLAVTGTLVWGRLLLAVFGRPLLDLDALFVSTLLGVARVGNLIWSEEAGMRVIIAPGCSSLQGISLAVVFWATVNQYFAVRFDRRAAGYGLAALAATVLVNVVRMGGMLTYPEHFVLIHTGWVSSLLMWATLLLVVGICVFGARREIFRSA